MMLNNAIEDKSLILNPKGYYQKKFNEEFMLLRINSITNKKTQSSVNTIIAIIKKRGDTSLISYVKKYDGLI